MLWLGGVKAFADGALGPHTAAMLQPYENDPANRGMLLLDREQIFDFGRQAAEAGYPMTVHAIGDAANHEVLEAFRALRTYERENGHPRRRHRVEHVQLLHPGDLDSLAELDVIASMQPIHATSDMRAADTLWGARAEFSYAWQTLLQRGTRMAFGSDAPVESPNPFLGLHAAVTRRRADGSPGPEGWYPGQRLSLTEALKGFTTGAAYAGGAEDRLGVLKAGFAADLIVMEKDLFAVAPEEIKDLLPVRTMVAGMWVM
jgi:predicted amidohydrolase YtcJ